MQRPNPKYFNFLLILMVFAHFFFPTIQIIYFPWTLIGILFLFSGILVNLWSVKIMNANKTPLDHFESPKKMVTDGIFKYSRNPIYLSGLIIIFGFSFLLGSLSSFIFPILLFIVLEKYYIPIEEKNLENKFGSKYRTYKNKVHKWI